MEETGKPQITMSIGQPYKSFLPRLLLIRHFKNVP